MKKLMELLETWQDDEKQTKKAFERLKSHLEAMPSTKFEVKARPGVSYSLRGVHENQTDKDLFTMVDIIDDDPSDRWLSVCFYGEMITDPEERGDYVPEGLMGEDATCFDVDNWDEELLKYVEQRLTEAHASAAKG